MNNLVFELTRITDLLSDIKDSNDPFVEKKRKLKQASKVLKELEVKHPRFKRQISSLKKELSKTSKELSKPVEIENIVDNSKIIYPDQDKQLVVHPHHRYRTYPETKEEKEPEQSKDLVVYNGQNKKTKKRKEPKVEEPSEEHQETRSQDHSIPNTSFEEKIINDNLPVVITRKYKESGTSTDIIRKLDESSPSESSNKRPLNKYQLFVKEKRREGYSMKEISELWKKNKS